MKRFKVLKMFIFLKFFLFLFWGVPNLVYSQYLNQIWQNVEFGSYFGGSKIWCVDLNNDGSNEIICSKKAGFSEGADYFSVLEYIGNDYKISWTSKWYGTDTIQAINIYDINQDGELEIFILLSSGNIDVYKSQTMELDTTYQTTINNARNLIISDVDNDGQIEFILASDDDDDFKINIINSLSLAGEWDTTITLADDLDIKVGNVDNDVGIEIILSSGIIIDGADHHIKWVYTEGFGEKIELADIGGNSVPEIIGISASNYITAFDAELQLLLWQFNTFREYNSLYITDLEDDGEFEILVGNSRGGGISCYSSATKQLLWDINNPQYGVTNICTGDPDRDGVKEIIWGVDQSSYGSGQLLIASSNLHQIEWQSADWNGPFSLDVFDFNYDGINEIAGASYKSNGGTGGGIALIYSGLNHIIKNATKQSVVGDAPINAIAAGNIDKFYQGELVAGVGNKIFVFDGDLAGISNQIEGLNIITSLAIADVDNDNTIEIVAGGIDGYLYIYNGKKLTLEWKGMDTGDPIEKIVITNCDEDDAQEIIFLNGQSQINIYDGKTHELEWQMTDFDNITSFDVADFDLDGNKEIILGHSNGMITTLTYPVSEITNQVPVIDEAIYGLVVANIDSSSANEILVGSSKVTVINAVDFSPIWESQPLGENVGFGNNLKVFDIDKDNYLDILVSSSWGIFQFEATSMKPDHIPPQIIAYYPSPDISSIELDDEVKVIFSERIDESSLNEANVFVTANDSATINTNITYIDSNNSIMIKPDDYLPMNSNIRVTLSGNIFDTSMNGLDGNKNGISEGSPEDDFSWVFITGTNLDTLGPNISSVTVNSDSLWKGMDLTINVSVSDFFPYNFSLVQSAECFIDTIGENGTGLPLIPLDGEFNAVDENCTITISTKDWADGEHHLFFHAQDTKENWGKFHQITINIIVDMVANWPMLGQNPQHTGFNALDSIQLPLRVKWSKKLADKEMNNLIVVNNFIYITSNGFFEDAILYALNIEDGSEEWVYFYGEIYLINPPAFAYGFVYAQTCNGSEGAFLNAFDARTGKLIWQAPMSAQWENYQAPTVADGKIFINGGYDGGIYCFDAYTGEELWFVDLEPIINWTTAYYEGIVYTAGSSSSFKAINSTTGQILYEFGKYGIGYTPAISNGVIYTVNPVSAIDLNTRKLLWSKPGKYTPAIGSGMVFSVASGKLNVYDEKTGQTLWSFSGDSKLNHSPIVANGFILVSSNDNTYAINIKTQELVWHYEKGGRLTVANNRLYLATTSGEVVAFEKAPTSIEFEKSNSPLSFRLLQNYPNPFNPTTTISYELPKSTFVSLSIYDIQGRLIKMLVNEWKSAGYHSVNWNAEKLGTGIYFYRLNTGEYSDVKKCIIIK